MGAAVFFGRVVPMEKKHVAALATIIEAMPRAAPVELIAEAEWGEDVSRWPGTWLSITRTRISQIRRKIEPEGFTIVPIFEVGYRLVPCPSKTRIEAHRLIQKSIEVRV